MIWINVSTSAAWRHQPFGIARVEGNVARALQTLLGPDRAGFCVWNRKRRAFVEWMDEDLGCLARRSEAGYEPVALGVAPAAGRPDALRAVGRGVRHLLPMGARTGVTGLVKPLRRFVAGAMDLVRSRASPAVGRRHASGLRSGAVAPCLRAGDVLVTLGLEWETGLMPYLQEAKRELDLRIIGCCHDLIPIKYPQYCPRYVAELFPQYLERLAHSCDAIACVSECTRRDLSRALSEIRGPAPELFRIRLGAELPEATGSPSTRATDIVTRPYLLCVSTIERRKNHEVLYRAFHRLVEVHDREKLPRLVLVGARGWGVGGLLDDIELDPSTEGLILILNDISDADLCLLYRNALFFVFPSLYEGWGLPVAEALGFGKPVICSDRGALTEVGGDLVEYVDPWDLPGWVRAIERLWLDDVHRERLADRIVKEYERDRWSGAAEAIGRVALEPEARPCNNGE